MSGLRRRDAMLAGRGKAMWFMAIGKWQMEQENDLVWTKGRQLRRHDSDIRL